MENIRSVDDLRFNIFLPTTDWEIKPYREYKGKGLLEQIVSGADNHLRILSE